ncbi:hypothetical protein WK54_23415 [Burkholderia ubonensis]|nr:hypothetical protein WK54_23415 [Burkholderia ubonensis]
MNFSNSLGTIANTRFACSTAPHLLERNFTAPAPNQIWTSDITYLATADGYLYLTVIIDLFVSAQ